MSRFGFVGASYSSSSLNADAQTCRNWYVEKVESDQGKGPFVLLDREGLVLFCTLPTAPVRGIFYADTSVVGRTFAVGGDVLYEILSDGTSSAIGTVGNDGKAITWAANATNTQVALCSDGLIYVVTLSSTALTQVPGATFSQGPVRMIDWIDDFFVALIDNSNIFYNSDPDDALSWPGANATEVSVIAGNIRSIKADNRQLGIMGKNRGVAYYNSGASTTPLTPIPGGNIQNGIGAADTLMVLDNTWFWMDQDERGAGIFRRYQSGGPVRVSNHAIEVEWMKYSTISDCIGFPYQNNGHSFAVLYFPTADKTWVYDVATGLWHERDFFLNGSSHAYLARCHSYAFNKHLVGDRDSGNIYQLSNSVQTDNGNLIRRVRRAPHISVEQERIYHSSLQVDVEVGLGPVPALTDGAGNDRDPQVILRWSDDSTKTWSNEIVRDCGQAGKYKTRVIWRRLGQSRDRIYELSATDPVPFRITDAYLKATGFGTQKRMVKELAEKA